MTGEQQRAFISLLWSLTTREQIQKAAEFVATLPEEERSKLAELVAYRLGEVIAQNNPWPGVIQTPEGFSKA